MLNMEVAHTKSVEEIYKIYDVSESTGLSNEQVEVAREKYGFNGE